MNMIHSSSSEEGKDEFKNGSSESALELRRDKGWNLLLGEIQSNTQFMNDIIIQSDTICKTKQIIHKWSTYDTYLTIVRQNCAIKLIIPVANKEGTIYWALFKGKVIETTLDTLYAYNKEVLVRIAVNKQLFGLSFNPWNVYLALYPGINTNSNQHISYINV